MSSSPTHAATIDATFVCDCEEEMRSACKGEPFYKEHESKRYCVLHFPGKEKSVDFERAFQRKIDSKDFNFRGVWFPDALSFWGFGFSAEADFYSATFSARADFNSAIFSAGASFRIATFMDYVTFADRAIFNSGTSLDLQFARIEKPEHVLFHTLILRPHWFVNVDARKFDFTNVDWDMDWNWRGINEEIERLEHKGVSSTHRMLTIACRHLAVNAEENHRYEEASRFRYMAMDARRLEKWRGFAFWRLSWWYWLASGYGERVFQAFAVLIGVWFISALLYTQVGFSRWEPKLASESDVATAKRDEVGAPLRLSRSLTYSLGVMTLQKPEPRPTTTAAQTFVILETILGPVQAALLALAIRRKFMR